MSGKLERFSVWVLAAGLASAGLAPAHATAAESARAVSADGSPEHAKHREMRQRSRYTVSVADYSIPADVTLRDQDGKAVVLSRLLDTQDPLLLQFIFTTCTTICPVMSASLAAARDELAAVDDDYRMVSISIDPEHDTPRVLRGYAERYYAGDRWKFLTGSSEAIVETLKAFDAYYPGNNKMYHQPYTYLRAGRDARWLRINGLLGAAELAAEYRSLLEAASEGTPAPPHHPRER